MDMADGERRSAEADGDVTEESADGSEVGDSPEAPTTDGPAHADDEPNEGKAHGDREDDGEVATAPTAMAPGSDGSHRSADAGGSASRTPPEGSTPDQGEAAGASSEESEPAADPGTDEPPEDVRQYERFTKVDGSRYERVNDFLRDRTHITAREWAIARLCADFRTETGVEMTKIGENLPELVPFMTDTYTPQAVNQARASFEEKVRMAGATFLYGAMCDFFTAEELDDVIYEATETAKFLLEVEGVDLAVEEELAAEDRISDVMREVRAASEALRNGPVECPDCGHEFGEDELE